MDFTYKLPPKIKVYTKKGSCFSPFKSMLTVLNEDSMTVFWKMYPGSESFGTQGARDDLVRLKERFDYLGSEIKVIYVDNCCTVRNMLTSVYEKAEVKFDAFHWI